jgi:hypothetical protein
MPIQSRQGRIRAGDQITEAEMEAVRELNAARRVGRRRAREQVPNDDGDDYGNNNADLEDRIVELEDYRKRAIEMQRPYYAINGSTRTADLLARLADVNNPPTSFERENILGMLEVNNKFKWWKRRHPNQ